MKRTIGFLIALHVMIQCNAQNKDAQPYVDGAKTNIQNLEKKLASPIWKDKNFQTGVKSEINTLEEKISKIKQKDASYNVSEFESKLAAFKAKRDEALKSLSDGKAADKQKKEDEAKQKEQERIANLIIKDDGITNPIHEKYAGKIVFSTTEIPKENPTETKFSSDFKINSPIYARIYLRTSVFNEAQKASTSEIFDNHVGMVYKIYIDGNLAYQGRVSFKGDGKQYISESEVRTATSIGGILNFNKDALLSEAYIDALVGYDSKLTDGKHLFKIDLFPNYISVKPLTEVPIASGEFNLNVSRGFANAANLAICMPKAVKKDPAFETKYKECVKKYLVNNNKDAIMKSFVLLSGDWEIRKNDITGFPISRTMYGAAGLSYKDGKCKYETFSFTQNWNGSSYSTTIETSTTGQDGNIFCDCLK